MALTDWRDYVLPVTVPGGIEPAEWARQWCPKPEVVPADWPASARMAYLVVIRKCPYGGLDHDCETAGFLVTRPAAMHGLATHDPRHQLWFLVPRALFTPDVCPDLTPEHWPPR